EGETESQWLQDTGLWGLLDSLGANGDHQGLLSTLTQTQMAAVCRRLDIYARSARRRHKARVRDVRDIFGVFDSGVSKWHGGSQHGGHGRPCLREVSVMSPWPERCSVSAAGLSWCTQAMDSAYSEQVAGLLQRGRPPPAGTCVRGNGSLPGAGNLRSAMNDDDNKFKNINVNNRVLTISVIFIYSVITQSEEEECWSCGWLGQGPSCWNKFRILKGRLGVTRIGDLSLQDMKKIPPLALIELTALCDVLGVDLKRSKAAKRRATETRLFGMPLDTLLEADRKVLPSTQVPLVLQALLSCLEKRGLDTEGILRVPGSQTRIKGLEKKLERDFYTGLFSWDEVHHNDASDLLKRFIRELPAPLLTAEYLPAFAVVPNIPNLKQRLQALHLLILLLPEPNRNTLKALLEFLRKVVAREQSNKMTLWNVSTVMAPNLFLHQGQPPKLLRGKEKQLAEGAAEVVQMMVHYQDLLWTVASFLVAQVRKLNESSSRRFQICDRGLKTWLRRMHADRDKAEDGSGTVSILLCTDGTPKVAKIQVACSIKDPVEVLLTRSTKVAHVLRQFSEYHRPRSQGQDVRLSSQELYEVGGNISEHRLDPDAYLLDLYRANPHGEWVIKQ
uniref:Rho GTPase activating protein 40 n=1 Tax=Loxodonta africana TaxID=9785 RepID=G3U4B8_LOXAF